jgi:hypothetical protein
LLEGAQPLVKAENKDIILALREIAAGKVKMLAPTAKKAAKKASKYVVVKIEEERLYS